MSHILRARDIAECTTISFSLQKETGNNLNITRPNQYKKDPMRTTVREEEKPRPCDPDGSNFKSSNALAAGDLSRQPPSWRGLAPPAPRGSQVATTRLTLLTVLAPVQVFLLRV
jgi:hypothetical protein